MAETVNDLITRAFQSTSIVRVGQPPSGTQLSYGLGVLNEMLGLWADDEIEHGLGNSVTAATTVYSPALASAIRKNLAVELLNGPYHGNLSPLLLSQAVKEKNNLMPYDSQMEYDTALSRPDRFRIERGA